MGSWSDYLQRVARPELYSDEQWFAAVLSLICLELMDGPWCVPRRFLRPLLATNLWKARPWILDPGASTRGGCIESYRLAFSKPV
jgi:hypothetical protein